MDIGPNLTERSRIRIHLHPMLSRMVDGAQGVKYEANSNGRKMEIRSPPSVMTFSLTNDTRDWG